MQKYISYNHHSVHVAAFPLPELTEAVTCAVIALFQNQSILPPVQ
jgi:hypothetical protein